MLYIVNCKADYLSPVYITYAHLYAIGINFNDYLYIYIRKEAIIACPLNTFN